MKVLCFTTYLFEHVHECKHRRQVYHSFFPLFDGLDVGDESGDAAALAPDEGAAQQLGGPRPLLHAHRQAAVQELTQLRTQLLGLKYLGLGDGYFLISQP